MALNPNYPVIEELWGPSWTAAGGALPSTKWVNLVDRTISQAMARRGKQYELDEAQAGEYQIVLGTQDGVLDPTNAAGPYGGAILPYQPYRRRAQWPPSANMLDAIVATGGDGVALGAFSATFPVLTTAITTGGTVAIPTSPLTAFQGTNVFRTGVKTSATSGSRILYCDTVGIKPGRQVTFQCRVRNITDSTSLSVKAHIGFYSTGTSFASVAYGTVTSLTGSSTVNGWTQLTVTATCPTSGGVYGMSVGISAGGVPAAQANLESDGWQLELGGSASAWVAPGTWYPIFSGFTERWPTQWAEGGTYGQVSPTGVDAFALLSQVTLKEVFLEEIESLSPRFCFTLGDGVGATSFADATGTYQSAPAVMAKTGSGNWTSGNSVSAASVSGVFTGSTGTVVTAAPVNPGVSTVSPATMLGLDDAGIKGPATSAWTRMIAFRYGAGTNPATAAQVWLAQGAYPATITGPPSGVEVFVNSSGFLGFSSYAPGQVTTPTLFSSTQSVTDGNWHLAIFGFSGTTMVLSLDGVTTSSTVSANQVPTVLGDMADKVGAAWNYATRSATNVYKGDLAFVTEFPSLLSSSAMSGLYSTWRSCASGESSSARYSRILRYSGYLGASNIGTGLTTSMGPASDLGGADVMSALSNVVTTENGEHFVAADGTVTFQGRGVRYNALTPTITFGEASGEYPYEDLQLDFDSTHLANSATVTQQSTGTNFVAQDSASIASYYTRTLTRTLNTTSGLESQDAADYFVSRYKDPMTRVQAIKLHPSANTALWPVLLSLELGTRVRINRRPPGAPIVTVDCFVEQIQWEMDSANEAWVTLQCSPVDSHPYAEFAAFHTTLNTGVSAGATSITLNAGADNTNQLAAQLSAGASLVIGLGTANQETVTLTGVGVTTSGWTSSACGISALVNSHSANEVICEVLPSGVTDATYYDATEQFDKVMFAY